MKITNYSGVQLSKTSQNACFSSPRPLAAFVRACAVDVWSLKGPVKAEIIRCQDKGERPRDDITGVMMQKLENNAASNDEN